MVNIDDTYTIFDDKLRGRKPKFKLEKNNKNYIYKYGAVNNEIWAELIAEQLGLQAGIEMAHYQLATYKDTIGVITNYFLKSTELIISSDKLKEATHVILAENNIDTNLKENTILNIVQAASIYDNRIDTEELTTELMKRWAFYGIIMESDKNATNIGFIKGESGISLTPDYDNSSMAGLNKNIQNNIDLLRRGQSIYNYTDNIKNHLQITEKDTGYFIEDFKNFVEKYPIIAKKCMESFDSINVEEAMEKVEIINDTQIPWNIKYWVNKTVNSRLNDMRNIYEKTKPNVKVKIDSLSNNSSE